MPPMTRPPRTPCSGLPRPPNRLVPPMTAAATAYRTYWPPWKLLLMPAKSDAYWRIATPAVTEHRANAAVRIMARLRPARRRAPGLPPEAWRYGPTQVRPLGQAKAPTTTSTTWHGADSNAVR